ncbi:ROK family protein [Alicyclobacillus macrosporangiidus]|uniref:ROK family protein n=1 Tax=Alicyclobacillus macrosporangiidus TaxID=392015 RepID=UPI000495CAE6|nr:ROK family protein [Alicyclobacillus macrosporangiidus]
MGSSRTAGEIGHVVVDPDGPRCTCGQRGCLERMVSVPAVFDGLGAGEIDPADNAAVAHASGWGAALAAIHPFEATSAL